MATYNVTAALATTMAFAAATSGNRGYFLVQADVREPWVISQFDVDMEECGG